MQMVRLPHLSRKTTTMPLLLKPAALAILLVAATSSYVYYRLSGPRVLDCNTLLPLPGTTHPQQQPPATAPAGQLPPPSLVHQVSQPQPVNPQPVGSQPASPQPGPLSPRKIQVAILLDVSNSMDGLINQAKAQLWNMVSVLGKARCDNQHPQIELALYEYGRSSNNPQQGYIRQVNSFTRNLDDVSRNLFALSTNGGDEYCGQVMLTSLDDLPWQNNSADYKVIFIAGNEDFLQGSVPFTKACAMAKQKGVVVNTIYCGDRLQGIREHWNLGAECGNGSFTHINSDAQIRDIPTPYDQDLITLNQKLNDTYIGYGNKAEEHKQMQADVDKANYEAHPSVAAKRISVKGSKSLYVNSEWDLVDAREADSLFIKKLKPADLPDNLKGKSKEELERIVSAAAATRTNIRKQIGETTIKRENFLKAERAKQQGQTEQTLETEIEKILREQAKRYRMEITQ